MSANRNSAPPDHRDSPTYWFAILEIARERCDFEQAVEAKRQLRRLGVNVTYRRPVASAGGRRDA